PSTFLLCADIVIDMKNNEINIIKILGNFILKILEFDYLIPKSKKNLLNIKVKYIKGYQHHQYNFLYLTGFASFIML
ncbi:MAG TPA: hypothetical protein DEO36_11555, partial [Flavobacteriaceae bacterium]|nr:hypothetical protein [Flavobacteriaceae bacterium]